MLHSSFPLQKCGLLLSSSLSSFPILRPLGLQPLPQEELVTTARHGQSPALCLSIVSEQLAVVQAPCRHVQTQTPQVLMPVLGAYVALSL